jgi:hypothetical protein
MPLTIRTGVELAKAGVWDTSTGKWTCTRAQIADAVRAGSRFRPPIVKPGHVDSRFDGEPALGRVLNMRASADGDTLLGDLEIPDWLDEQLHIAYPHRSVEADLGVETADGERYGAVVTGLALLGVTPPAIASLAELQARMAGPGQEAGYVAASAVAASFGVSENSDVANPIVHPDGSTSLEWPRGWDARAPQVSRIGAHRVDVTPKMRAALGLDESADEQAVEAALEALRTKAEQPAPKPAEAPVVETGIAPPPAAPAADQAAIDAVIDQKIAAALGPVASKLSATETANGALRDELSRVSGELAARRQAEAVTKRESVLASAVQAGKIRPADRDRFAALYDVAPEQTVATLDALATGSAVPVMASGYAGSSETATDDDALYGSWFPKVGD